IHAVLRERRDTLPSPSTIYRVLTRYGLNRRTPAMREEKRRIIKDKLGELGHVDLHQLPRDMFLAPPPATAYIVSLIDSCSHQALPATDQRQGRTLLANPRRGRHRGRNLRQSRSLRQRTVRVPRLLQQPQAPSGPCRKDPEGIRRNQDHRDPISELVNISNCE